MRRQIIDVEAVDCGLAETSWRFASERAPDIEAHWRRRLAGNPHLFNGTVLLLLDGAVRQEPSQALRFRGSCFKSDFKTFMAWREFGFPETGVRNIFSMAAIETLDGAFVLGEMATHTAPAGQIYFPSGTPDPTDIKGDRVDIEGSAARELAEETGLGAADVTFMPGLRLVLDAVRVCCMKRVKAKVEALALVERIHDWLAEDTEPELARMHIVRSPADIRPAMPDFVADYLTHAFASR